MQTSNQVVDEVVWSVTMSEGDFRKLFYENPLEIVHSNPNYYSLLKYDPRVVLITDKMGVDFNVLLNIAFDISKGDSPVLTDNEIAGIASKSIDINAKKLGLPDVSFSDSKFSGNIIDKINSMYVKYSNSVMDKTKTQSLIGPDKRFKNSFEFLDFVKDLGKISPLRTHFIYKKSKNMNNYVLNGSSGSPNIIVVVPFDRMTRINQAKTDGGVDAIYSMISKIRVNGQETKYKSVYRRDIGSNTGYFHFDLIGSQGEEDVKMKYFELVRNPFIFSRLIKKMKNNGEIASAIGNNGSLNSKDANVTNLMAVNSSTDTGGSVIPDVNIDSSSDPISYQLSNAVSPDGCPAGTTYQICVKSGIALNSGGTSGTITVIDGSGWCGM